MFRKNPIILAVSSLCAAPAFAIQPGTSPDVSLFISGSSAATPILEAAFADACVSGTLDEYRGIPATPGQTAFTNATTSDYGASDQNYTAYYCQFKSSGNSNIPSTLYGKNVLVYKRSAGGSIYGVNSVALATAIGNMPVTTANCKNVATGQNVCSEASTALVTTSDGVAADSTIPEAGISDVEPTLLQNVSNLASGFSALTSTQLSADLTVAFPFAQGFGIAVSSDVYQYVTNLTKPQITSILAGKYTDWSEVNGNLSGTINICIRQPGSGTLAGAQAQFLGLGCQTTGSLPFAASAQAFSSTGTVRACLNNTLSIGILGLVDGPNNPPTTTDTWKFISINGVAPTQANLAQAVYPNYVESAMTIRKVAPLPTSLQSAVFNTLKAELGSYSVISTLPTVSGNPNLAAAIVALDPTTLDGVNPVVNSSGAFVYNTSYPISWATKGNNTCQPAAPIYP
jgi:ABC-type phosphate transport system substrate-binding protein